ncbi:hypothetical protein C6501_07685 [Candidatus Poribacteria bacterium]|nr:MAG: hypothetical protein C6501_07685 [Candidatus Poribacteria bacterium]
MIKHLFFGLLVFALPLSALAQTGTIEGTVLHESTGEPLAGAEVRIIEIDQQQTTDASGKFVFTDIEPGTWTVSVSHEAYTTQTKTLIEVQVDETTKVKMFLREVVELETVVVKGDRPPSTVSRKRILGSELLRIPGTANDILRGITTLPGIGIPNDLLGILYIRGSEPDSNLYYFDRTPLGYPFHGGGLLSTISSEIIEDVEIYAGGYGAEFGLDSQSVLDIHSRNRLDKRWRGKFNLNFLYSEGILEGKIGKKGYAYVAARRSYFDLIVGPFVDEEFPYFSDAQFKFVQAFGKKHFLTLNAFAATDHFNTVEEGTKISPGRIPGTEVAEVEVWSPTAYFKNGFEGQGIHLRSNFSDNLTSYFSLTRSVNFLNVEFRNPIDTRYHHSIVRGDVHIWDEQPLELFTRFDTYTVRVNVPVWTLREDVTFRLNPRFQIEPGILFSFSPAISFEESKRPQLESIGRINTVVHVIQTTEDGEIYADYDWEREREKFIVTGIKETRDEFGHDFFRAEGYLQGRYNLFSFMSVALGARLDYLDMTEEVSIQPRGSVNFELPIGSNLRFGYGHYEQSPKPFQVLSQDGNPALKSSLSQHYILEIDHKISPQTEVRLATYYKNSDKLVTKNKAGNYLNQGAGYVGGAEVFVRHRVLDKFFGWVSYSWTHAERRKNPDANYKPHLFDRTRIVSIVANYSFTPNFEIGAKWQYLSGTSEASINSITLVQDPITRGLNPLLAAAEENMTVKLETFHKLDLRVSRKWKLWGTQIGGFLDILNVYNRKNKIKLFVKEPQDIPGTGNDTSDAFDVVEEGVGELPQLPLIVYLGLTLDF